MLASMLTQDQKMYAIEKNPVRKIHKYAECCECDLYLEPSIQEL